MPFKEICSRYFRIIFPVVFYPNQTWISYLICSNSFTECITRQDHTLPGKRNVPRYSKKFHLINLFFYNPDEMTCKSKDVFFSLQQVNRYFEFSSGF